MDTDKLVDKAFGLVNEVAQKVGQTVDVLWPRAVRYVSIEAWSWIAMCVIVIVAATSAFRHAFRSAMTMQAPEDRYLAYGLICGTYGVVSFAMLYTIFLYLPRAIEPVGYLVVEAISKATR